MKNVKRISACDSELFFAHVHLGCRHLLKKKREWWRKRWPRRIFSSSWRHPTKWMNCVTEKQLCQGLCKQDFYRYTVSKKDFYRYTLILGWKKKKGKRGDKERVKNQRILCGGEKKKSIAYYYQLKNSLWWPMCFLKNLQTVGIL